MGEKLQVSWLIFRIAIHSLQRERESLDTNGERRVQIVKQTTQGPCRRLRLRSYVDTGSSPCLQIPVLYHKKSEKINQQLKT